MRRAGEERNIASVAEFDHLLEKLRKRLDDVSPEAKRRIIHALIQKIVVTKTGFELHYFAGVEQIKVGEMLSSPPISLDKKIFAGSSFIYLNGGPSKNRTCNKALGKLRYIHLTMGPRL